MWRWLTTMKWHGRPELGVLPLQRLDPAVRDSSCQFVTVVTIDSRDVPRAAQNDRSGRTVVDPSLGVRQVECSRGCRLGGTRHQ
jgi:hypothetical protein